jgi:hypothetical protein
VGPLPQSEWPESTVTSPPLTRHSAMRPGTEGHAFHTRNGRFDGGFLPLSRRYPASQSVAPAGRMISATWSALQGHKALHSPVMSKGNGSMERGISRRGLLLGAGGGLTAAAVFGAVDVDARAQAQGTWKSMWFKNDASGVFVPRPDAEGNRIPDFSHAGYRNGAELPSLPVVASISPIAGDNTAHIQAAIDAVSARVPDQNGHRGAVLLAPGTYEVRGTVRIDTGGVVLRGSGRGSDPASNTVLRATGNTPAERTVVTVGAWSSDPWSGRVGKAVDITTGFVPVGSRRFRVADARRGLLELSDALGGWRAPAANRAGSRLTTAPAARRRRHHHDATG